MILFKCSPYQEKSLPSFPWWQSNSSRIQNKFDRITPGYQESLTRNIRGSHFSNQWENSLSKRDHHGQNYYESFLSFFWFPNQLFLTSKKAFHPWLAVPCISSLSPRFQQPQDSHTNRKLFQPVQLKVLSTPRPHIDILTWPAPWCSKQYLSPEGWPRGHRVEAW